MRRGSRTPLVTCCPKLKKSAGVTNLAKPIERSHLLLPGSLLVGPGEGGGGLALGLGDLTGVGALKSIRDLVEKGVAGAVHGAAALEGVGDNYL